MNASLTKEQQAKEGKTISDMKVDILVTQNGYVIKSRKGWFVFSNRLELLRALGTFLDELEKQREKDRMEK